jgi:hypothetical protein
VEADFALRGLGFEIRSDIADLQRHDSPPSPLETRSTHLLLRLYSRMPRPQ